MYIEKSYKYLWWPSLLLCWPLMANAIVTISSDRDMGQHQKLSLYTSLEPNFCAKTESTDITVYAAKEGEEFGLNDKPDQPICATYDGKSYGTLKGADCKFKIINKVLYQINNNQCDCYNQTKNCPPLYPPLK